MSDQGARPSLAGIRAWHRSNLGVDNDGAALVAALDGVLALHQPVASQFDPGYVNCLGCGGTWPCFTRRAITEHISLEDQ